MSDMGRAGSGDWLHSSLPLHLKQSSVVTEATESHDTSLTSGTSGVRVGLFPDKFQNKGDISRHDCP
jgi:hypothetical protein